MNVSAAAQGIIPQVETSQSVYGTGDTLRVAVAVSDPSAPVAADVYVVLQLPGTSQAVSLVYGGAPVFGTLSDLRSLAPTARGVTLASAVRVDSLFEYVWMGSEPLGSYQIHMAVVRPGALADGVIGEGELIAYTTASFTLQRSFDEVLQPTARRESLIEPEGGDVTTTSAQGAAFTLSVPPGAVVETTPIAITPVTSIANLPLSGTLQAALKLEPDGLVLNRPVTLTFELPSSVPTEGLLGFLYSGTGGNFEVLPVEVNGNIASIEVSHFSTAGLASGSAADFIAEVSPLLAALPATLPPSQVNTLVSMLVTWVDRFGLQLCDETATVARSVCTQVYEKGLASLALHVQSTCAQATASLDAGEPFVAFNTLHTVMQLVVRMAELNGLAAQLGRLVVVPTAPELTCIKLTLARLIPAAETFTRSRLTLVIPSSDSASPPVPLMDSGLQLLQNIGGNAGLLSLVDQENEVIAATVRLLRELLPVGQALCPVEPFRADALLFRPVQLFSSPFLDGLSPGLGDEFEIAAAGCRVVVTPSPATIGPGRQVQFSATLADPLGIPSNFVWQLDSSCTGSITASGLFTAGTTEQDCEVTAIVPPGGPLATRRPFFKVARVTTRNDVTIASRSVEANKSLSAGTNTAQFRAGPFTVNIPRTEAFVDAQTLTSKLSDPLDGTASVDTSRIVLDVNTLQHNRVISGNGNLASSVSGNGQAAVVLRSSLTAELSDDFNCTLQVSTSAAGIPSSLAVTVSGPGGTVFNVSASGSQTSVCLAGTYTLAVLADGQVINGPDSLSRVFSFTLTLSPRPSP
jgi:hypothetical protein